MLNCLRYGVSGLLSESWTQAPPRSTMASGQRLLDQSRPPRRSRPSKISELMPALRKKYDVATPAMPAPIIRTGGEAAAARAQGRRAKPATRRAVASTSECRRTNDGWYIDLSG